MNEEKAGAGAQPSEEEMQAALEEEIKKVRVEDLLLQSQVSILNLAARRIAKEDERDLEQARIGIEAVRATVELAPEAAQAQLQQALSELQMLYAKHREGGQEGGEGDGGGDEGASGDGEEGKGDSGLWTPSGS